MHNVWGQYTLHELLWTFLSLHYVLLHISLSSVSYTDRQIIYADTTDCLTSFTYSVCVCVCVCVCIWSWNVYTPFFYTSKLTIVCIYTCIMHNACIYCTCTCIRMYIHVYTCMLCVKCGFTWSAVRECRPASLIVAAVSRDTWDVTDFHAPSDIVYMYLSHTYISRNVCRKWFKSEMTMTYIILSINISSTIQ